MKYLCAVFVSLLCVGPIVASVPSPPPSAWKGITYAPRYHPFWRMLYEYYDYDSTLGEYVYQAVDSDLALLSSQGFNLVHLYLWDHEALDVTMQQRWCTDGTGRYYKGCTPPYGYDPGGFYNSNVSTQPTQTPAHNPAYTQGQALDDFLARAENHGLYVMIHFADFTLLDEAYGHILTYTDGTQSAPNPLYCADSNPSCIAANAPQVASQFNAWSGDFINLLARISIFGPAHRNFLAVGFEFSFPDGSVYSNTILQNAYSTMLNQLGSYRQAVTGEGLLAMDIGFGINTSTLGPTGQNMFVRPSTGYPWSFTNISSVTPYLPQGQPDLWMIQTYNPNAVDFSNGLAQLEASGVPASKILVSEFATSSSISSSWDSTYLSYLFMTYGDDTTPTGDQNFQAAWTGPTLCALAQNSVTKFAYWTMYDAPSFWQSSPWYWPGYWYGYWGLGNESPSAGMKPVFTTLANYNPVSPACSPMSSPIAPVVQVSGITSYITINQYARFGWVAANTSGITVNGVSTSPSPISDCSLSAWNLDAPLMDVYYNPIYTWGGSCALGFGATNASPGTANYTFQVQGMNGASPYITTIPVTVGYNTIVQSVNGQTWNGQTVSQPANGYFTVNGVGFNYYPYNQLIWTRSGYPQITMYNGDSYGDGSTYYFFQYGVGMVVNLGGRLAPGLWYVSAWNGLGYQSSQIPVQIY